MIRPIFSQSLVWAVGFALASIALNRELLPHMTTALPGNAGDPMLNAWILGWVSDAAVSQPGQIWNAPIFHPHDNALAMSEHLMGVALFVAPVYWLTADAVLTYNVAFLAGYAFLGWAMFVLVRGLTGRTDAALLAGVVVMSSPYFTSSQVARVQMLTAGWSLLTFHWLRRWQHSDRAWHLVACTLCWGLQLKSNLYLGMFLAAPFGVLLLSGLVRGLPRLTWRHAGALSAAGLGLALVAWPVLRQYAEASRELGLTHSANEVRAYSASLRSYASVWHSRQPAWLWAEEGADRALFPGTPLAVLALGGLVVAVRRRRETGDSGEPLAYAAATLAVFGLTLGPQISLDGRPTDVPGPYGLLAATVPGFDSVRAPGRLGAFVVLGLGVLAGTGAATLLAGGRRRLRYGAVTAVAAVAFVEGHRDYDWLAMLPVENPSATAAYAWLATQPPAALLEMPVVTDFQAQPRYAGGSVTLRYQLATLRHGHALVNGSSGFVTPLVTLLQSHASPFTTLDSIDDALAVLRRIGTRYIVAHRHEYVSESLAHVDGIQRAMRADTAQVEDVREFGSTVVLTLRPAAPEPPPTRQARLDVSDYDVSVSHNHDVAHHLSDADLGTRWTGPQHGRTWLEVRLRQPRVLGGLKLSMPRFGVADYPHHLRVLGTDAAGREHVLFDRPAVYQAAMTAVLEPHEPGVRIHWPAVELTRMRLEQPVVAGDRRWAIYELHVLGEGELPMN